MTQELDKLFSGLGISDKKVKMNVEELTRVFESAVRVATQAQKIEFDQKLEQLSQKIQPILTEGAEIKTYEETKIINTVKCDEPLDIVKSLPDFDGKLENYVSWRQAAHTAYKVFEQYNGSSKHYQAVGIIRNKVKGPADAVLASFNTVLNFSAIIARLDFTYSDKRPLHLIEQELSTLRQGNLSVLKFYDEVERNLTLLTNKTLMTYDRNLASAMNSKYRADALRVFISGLRRPLNDVLFSSRPSDLPTALALAQEIDANHERYVFATTFANRNDDRRNKAEPKTFKKNQTKEFNDRNYNFQQNSYRQKNPYYTKNYEQNNSPVNDRFQAEPMDIDPSTSRFKQQNNFPNPNTNWSQKQQFKRRAESDRNTAPKFQRINHVTQKQSQQENERYDSMAENEAQDVDDEGIETPDLVNFLEDTPCYHS